MLADVMGAGTPAIESMTARLWLSNLYAGTIIGKGGASIKAIREETACRVLIAEAPHQGAERLVTTIGPPLSINRAVALMLDKIDEANEANPAAQAAVAASGQPAGHVLKLCVSNNQVGALIGKGGAQIKDFREGSGAMIKVDSTTGAEAVASRLVTVSGGKSEVLRAHELIVTKLSTVPEDGPAGAAHGGHAAKYQRTQQTMAMPPMAAAYPYGAPPPQQHAYSPPAGAAGYRPYAPPSYGGYAPQPQQQQMAPPGHPLPSPASGATYYGAPPAYVQQGGGYAPPPGGAQPSAYGARALPAPPSGGYAAQPPQPRAPAAAASYAPAGYSFSGYGEQPAYASNGGGGALPPGGGGSWCGAAPSTNESGEMVQLVPSNLAGRLIGKGGSGIKEIRERTGAQIKILTECEPGTDQRRVTITGTPDAQQMALALINQKLAQGV